MTKKKKKKTIKIEIGKQYTARAHTTKTQISIRIDTTELSSEEQERER